MKTWMKLSVLFVLSALVLASFVPVAPAMAQEGSSCFLSDLPGHEDTAIDIEVEDGGSITAEGLHYVCIAGEWVETGGSPSDNPVTPTTTSTPSTTHCIAIYGDTVYDVENGISSLENGVVCAYGVWTPLPNLTALTVVPRGETYAYGVQSVGFDGWTRILEGVRSNPDVPAEYLSWNFFIRIYCNRPIVDGELVWTKPIQLDIAALDEPLTCSIEIKRDLASSEDPSLAMDPYDASLAGQGPMLGWFLTGFGVVQLDNQPNMIISTEGCPTCTVPTSKDPALDGVVLAPEWAAPASTSDAPHHVAIIRNFERGSIAEEAKVLSYLITLQPGQTIVLWQGILTAEQAGTTSSTLDNTSGGKVGSRLSSGK